MPLRGHTGHEMYPRGLAASESRIKSRPGHLVSSAWCLWIVHKVGFYKSIHKYIFSQNSVSKPPISTNLSKLDRQYPECDLHLQTKMYFSISDYKVGFRKSSHIIIVILFSLKKI